MKKKWEERRKEMKIENKGENSENQLEVVNQLIGCRFADRRFSDFRIWSGEATSTIAWYSRIFFIFLFRFSFIFFLTSQFFLSFIFFLAHSLTLSVYFYFF